MKNYKKYIVPIETGVRMGIGVFVENYFATAGHMFKNSSSIMFQYEGQRYSLNKEDAVILEDIDSNGSSDNQLDIALFNSPIPGQSPLNFADGLPKATNSLTLLSLNHKISKEIFSPELNPYELISPTGLFVREIYNFFECDINEDIREGHSGSPIIYGNQVFGILSGCLDKQNHPERILFCSTRDIIKM